MQRCEVCGDDDLEFIDGEITCRMCGTQCTTQQTEVVLDQTTQLRYLTQIAGVSQTQMDTTVREAPSRTLPWKLSEAFQLIFFAQVRAVQAKLSLPKDYVKMSVQLWIRYLKATGEAFISEEDRISCQYPCGWGYIYDPDQGAETINLEKVRRKRFYQRKTMRDPQKQSELLDSERNLREMDFDDGDHPLSETSSSSSSDSFDSCHSSSISDLSFVEDNTRASRAKPKATAPPKPAIKKDRRRLWRGWCGEEIGRWYLLEYNLAVCYVPLLYLRSGSRPFGLADLLDLVRRHLVPFQNARTVLPSHLVIRDKHIANALKRVRSAPSRRYMVRIIRQLLDLLGMERLPRFPLLTHLSFRIDQLCLPPRMALLARRMAHRWLTDDRAAPLPKDDSDFRRSAECNAVCPDVVTMGFIVLLLFCLRGSDAEEAKRREALVLLLRDATGRDDLFLWNEWAACLARVRHVGRSVMSIENVSGFLDLPNVGALIQEDLSCGPEVDADDAAESKLGRAGGRAIQPHEQVLLIEKEKYVKSLMAPFQPLIERAMEREEKEWKQMNETLSKFDFKQYFLCYPVEDGTLETLLEAVPSSSSSPAPSGSTSPLLFSQDVECETKDPAALRVKQVLEGLPTETSLGSDVVIRLPAKAPADFKEVLCLCAHSIQATVDDLWLTAQSLQLSLIRSSSVDNKKLKKILPQTSSSIFPLRWRPMFDSN